MAVYSNSKLAKYTILSPNCTAKRNHKIDTITIHCMDGNLSARRCGEMFKDPARKASSNYGVDTNGEIALYVPEESRSWASSSAANDHRAITIEVANDGAKDTGYHVSDRAIQSLINLLVDVCQRNNIASLKWKNDRNLIGIVEKQNMTVHRWFTNKSCPGDYLMSKMEWIASEVNKRLNAEPEPIPADNSFLVRINCASLNIRKGPGTNYGTNGAVNRNQVFTITEVSSDGKWGKLKSGAGWISLSYVVKL